MKLKPLEGPDFSLAARWLAQKENYQWLDFGRGTQILSPVTLKVMAQRDIHIVRLFTSDEDDVPVGVVGLSDINRIFKTATIWAVLGEKSFSRKGYTTRAVSRILSEGFSRLGLNAVLAWVVDQNAPSLRVAEKTRFKFIGRQRQCHYIDDTLRDRILFDLLASEHKDISDARMVADSKQDC